MTPHQGSNSEKPDTATPGASSATKSLNPGAGNRCHNKKSMEKSNDYPLGGMIEPHNIESEKEMTEKFGEPIPVPGHTDDSKPISANEMCHDCDFICEFHNRHCDHFTLTEENSELVRNLAAALNMPDDEDQEEDQMVYSDEISEDIRT